MTRIIKTLAVFVLAFAGLCSTVQATKFDCMGSGLAGVNLQTLAPRQFGTRAGDWENPIKFVSFDKVANKTAGMGLFWYCRLPAMVDNKPNPACAPVPVPVGVPAGTLGSPNLKGMTANASCIRINSLHATIAQLAALPDNSMAQIRAQGALWLGLVQPRQCWEMERDNSYPSTDELHLCNGLLAKARAVAPR